MLFLFLYDCFIFFFFFPLKLFVVVEKKTLVFFLFQDNVNLLGKHIFGTKMGCNYLFSHFSLIETYILEVINFITNTKML